MSTAAQEAKSVLAGLEVLDSYAPGVAEDMRKGWDLSYPLAQLIVAGHVAAVTAAGLDDLRLLDNAVTLALSQVEQGMTA